MALGELVLTAGYEIVATVENLRTLRSETLVRIWIECLGKPIADDKYFIVHQKAICN